jgi:MFS family permease
MAGEPPAVEGGPSSSSRKKVLVATVLGTTIEWYDFNIYGIAAALVLGPHFFPKLSDTAGTIAASATFLIGFIARPFGAALFGHFGDRIASVCVYLMRDAAGMELHEMDDLDNLSKAGHAAASPVVAPAVPG